MVGWLELERNLFMKSWLRGVCVAAGLGLVLAGGLEAGTSDVFELNTSISGVTQWSVLTNPVIQKVVIKQEDLINLGLGQPLGSVVLPNQQLALVTTCSSNDMRIIVYDTLTSSNLATIGQMQAVSVISQIKRRQRTQNVISEVTMNFAQTATNGLAGGILFASGNITLTTNDCLKHYSGKLTGALGASFFFTNIVYENVIDLTVTNLTTNTYFVVSNFPVNVSNSMLSSGKKLGTLVEP